MTYHVNECWWQAASAGTGSFVVSSAVTGYLTPAQCTGPAIIDTGFYYYRAESSDLTQHELGIGTWDDGTSTLARSVILQSTNSGSVVNFSAAPTVRLEAVAQSLDWAPVTIPVADTITLDTEGQTFIIRPGETYQLETGSSGLAAMFTVTADNCTIASLIPRTGTIDGNRALASDAALIYLPEGVSGTRILGLNLINSPDFAIQDDGSINTRIEGNYFTNLADSAYEAIYRTTGTFAAAQVLNNEIDRSAEDGTTLQGGGIIIHGDDDATVSAFIEQIAVTGNKILMPQDQAAAVSEGIGVEIFAALNGTVNNNTIIGGSEGIAVAAISADMTVTGNAVSAQMFIGIEIDQGLGNTVTGNSVDVSAYDVTLQGGAAIAINNGARASVIGNNVISQLRGIMFSTNAGGSCEGNTITIDGDGSAVYCQGSLNPTIGANEYIQNTVGQGSAITFENSQGGSVSRGSAKSFDTIVEITDNTGGSVNNFLIDLPLNINCTLPYETTLSGGSSWGTNVQLNLYGNDYRIPAASVVSAPYSILAMSGTQTQHTGTTVATVLKRITIPANAMGANGAVRATILYGASGAGGNRTFGVQFGGTVGTSYLSLIAGSATLSNRHQVEIFNRNNVASQVGNGVMSGGGWGTVGSAVVTSTISTASNVDLVFTGTLAVSTDTVSVEGYTVEYYHKD